jgi:hypothetical protein
MLCKYLLKGPVLKLWFFELWQHTGGTIVLEELSPSSFMTSEKTEEMAFHKFRAYEGSD